MKTTWIKLAMVALVLLTPVLLAGCRQREDKEGTEYFVYYLNGEGNQLVRESVYLRATAAEDVLEGLVQALDRNPDNVLYKKAKTDAIKLPDYTLSDKSLTLDFDASYLQLTGVNEVLCRAAIVKTLCQANGVDYVEFVVDDKELEKDGQLVGWMTESDFIDNEAGESFYRQTLNLSMFFSNKKGNRLVEAPIAIMYDGTSPLEQTVLQQLIMGPESIANINHDDVMPTLPKNAKLNQVSVKDRVAYVDVGEDVFVSSSDVNSEVVLYSIVNTLVELPTIDKVQFLIDGDTAVKVGDVNLDVPLERNLDIIKQ